MSDPEEIKREAQSLMKEVANAPCPACKHVKDSDFQNVLLQRFCAILSRLEERAAKSVEIQDKIVKLHKQLLSRLDAEENTARLFSVSTVPVESPFGEVRVDHSVQPNELFFDSVDLTKFGGKTAS